MVYHLRRVKKETKRFTEECLAGLERAKALRPTVVAAKARTIEGTLRPYNELLVAASATNALAGLMSEAGHLADQVGALGIGADQRERGLRGLAFAVQMVGVHRVEISERDLEPARACRHER